MLTPDRTYMRKELLNTRAYAIFVEELSKQIGFVNEKFSKQPLSETDSRELKAIFHTIKGGSGFFGLDQIYQNASKLETLLAGTLEEMDKVKKLMKKLEKNAGELPEPLVKDGGPENA